jgi:hypothetical protein
LLPIGIPTVEKTPTKYNKYVVNKKNSIILMISVSEYFLQTKICPFLRVRPDIFIINRNVTDHVVPWIIIIVHPKITK